MRAWGLSQCHQRSPGSVHLMLLQLSPVEKDLAHSAPGSLWSPHSLRGARCHGGLHPLLGMQRESLGRAEDAPPGPCPASLDQDCGLPPPSLRESLSGAPGLPHSPLPSPRRSRGSGNVQGGPSSAFIIPPSHLASRSQFWVHHHTGPHGRLKRPLGDALFPLYG